VTDGAQACPESIFPVLIRQEKSPEIILQSMNYDNPKKEVSNNHLCGGPLFFILFQTVKAN